MEENRIRALLRRANAHIKPHLRLFEVFFVGFSRLGPISTNMKGPRDGQTRVRFFSYRKTAGATSSHTVEFASYQAGLGFLIYSGKHSADFFSRYFCWSKKNAHFTFQVVARANLPFEEAVFQFSCVGRCHSGDLVFRIPNLDV